MSQRLVRLSFHYPSNWSFEGTVDLLWCDGSSERSYGKLQQGGQATRETYIGHRWCVREDASRELLLSIVVGQEDQLVTIGAEASLDPLRGALWQMGRAPREPLLKACGALLRLLQNIDRSPHEDKYRSVRAANPAIAATLDVPGALALLSSAGFEQEQEQEGGDSRLVLRPQRSLGPLQDALAQLRRLDALLRGLPPPQESSLGSMQAAAAAASAAASSSAAAEASHRCGHCRAGIHNDLRRQLAGSGEIGGWRTHGAVGPGEYRFHCDRCRVDLCGACYDQWKAGDASVHPLEHGFSIEAPITTPWGGSSYGTMPAPPPVTSRNRRGPWG